MTEQASTNKDSLVTYHREGFIGFITLNRPEKRNALNLEVWNAIADALSMAQKDREMRVVLVQGVGKSFCAGQDLSPENEVISVLSVLLFVYFLARIFLDLFICASLFIQ